MVVMLPSSKMIISDTPYRKTVYARRTKKTGRTRLLTPEGRAVAVWRLIILPHFPAYVNSKGQEEAGEGKTIYILILLLRHDNIILWK